MRKTLAEDPNQNVVTLLNGAERVLRFDRDTEISMMVCMSKVIS